MTDWAAEAVTVGDLFLATMFLMFWISWTKDKAPDPHTNNRP